MIDIIFTLLPFIFLIAVILNKIMSKRKSNESSSESNKKTKDKYDSKKKKESKGGILDQINDFKNEAYNNVESNKKVQRNSNEAAAKYGKNNNSNTNSVKGFKLFLIHLIWYKLGEKNSIPTSKVFTSKYLDDINYQTLYSQLKTLEKLDYIKTEGKIPDILIKITPKGKKEIKKNYPETSTEKTKKEEIIIKSIEEIITTKKEHKQTEELYSALLKDIKK